MRWSRVLLPEPDGPIIASDSPRPTSSETSARIASGELLFGESNRFETLETCSSGLGAAIIVSGAHGPGESANAFWIDRLGQLAAFFKRNADDAPIRSAQILPGIGNLNAASTQNFSF